MYTASELALLRASDPGVVIPGIDVPEGNPLPASSLKSYKTITTNTSAPVFYDPAHNRVVVKGNGTVLSGYDFSGVGVDVWANNVTIANCNFNGYSGLYYSVNQEAGYNGLTVKNCTFDASSGNNGLPAVHPVHYRIDHDHQQQFHRYARSTPSMSSTASCRTITFRAAGYVAGTHADAIGVFNTTGPVLITNNFIDWTNNPGRHPDQQRHPDHDRHRQYEQRDGDRQLHSRRRLLDLCLAFDDCLSLRRAFPGLSEPSAR